MDANISTEAIDKSSINQQNPQWIIDISEKDNLAYIRSIVECKNQQSYFDELSDQVTPEQFQKLGLVMLFVSVENNSELVFGAFKHLNTMHSYFSKTKFKYEKHLLSDVQFKSIANTYLDDLLLIIYACLESFTNGVRAEALKFFTYWIKDLETAKNIFTTMINHWPWTNKNKYYFLSIIFENHNFYEMVNHFQIDTNYFLQGVFLSLQYRNLISPGQMLVKVLWRQKISELYQTIANVLKNGSDFECYMCVNHWMNCLDNTRVIFDLLHLNEDNLLNSNDLMYLQENNKFRLVLFRNCFGQYFDKHKSIKEIDHFIHSMESISSAEHKIRIADILMKKAILNINESTENLHLLAEFYKSNMFIECSTWRQNIWRSLPGLFYCLASTIKTDTNTDGIKEFFNYLRNEIFLFGINQTAYQPLIFGLKMYEILVKTAYGSKDDHLIKLFQPNKCECLREFLVDNNVWQLCSLFEYNQLSQLLQSDFDDVRETACEILVRFFPVTDDGSECIKMLKTIDINKCSCIHYFVRLTKGCLRNQLYGIVKDTIRNYLKNYDDPFNCTKCGEHLFGVINCLTEFYIVPKNQQKTDDKCSIVRNLREDIEISMNVTKLLLDLLKFENNIEEGPPSFQMMDERLQFLIENSKYTSNDPYEDKKFLLMSIWMSLKACCDLAATISIYILNNQSNSLDNTNLIDCLNVPIAVLLQCRHKGAIEAAGLSLGKLVDAITSKFHEESDISAILSDPVENIFDIVRKTDTTRRGAGFSILILHLVRNDKRRNRPLLKYVMQTLMERATTLNLSPKRLNRDSVLASVLHFLCVLVKDAQLKSSLSPYMCEVFSIATSTIENTEWSVRNASLQLIGAFVPKLVGQTQFFGNEDIEWEPVYTTYNEIIIKMHSIHSTIYQLLSAQNHSDSPILLVMLLEIMSRLELLHSPSNSIIFQYKVIFSNYLSSNVEKVRNLSAKCLARFCEISEIPSITKRYTIEMFNGINANHKHGLILAVTYLLKRYDSDIRFMLVNGKKVLFDDICNLIRKVYVPIDDFYLKCYLLDLFLFIGFDKYDCIVSNLTFGIDCIDVEYVKDHLGKHFTENGSYGCDLFHRKLLFLYLDNPLYMIS